MCLWWGCNPCKLQSLRSYRMKFHSVFSFHPIPSSANCYISCILFFVWLSFITIIVLQYIQRWAPQYLQLNFIQTFDRWKLFPLPFSLVNTNNFFVTCNFFCRRQVWHEFIHRWLLTVNLQSVFLVRKKRFFVNWINY